MMTESYVPPSVTWTPIAGPDAPSAQSRDEYLEDRLQRAAASVWLFMCGRETGFTFTPADSYFSPPEDWIPDAVVTLRAVLNGEQIEGSEVPIEVFRVALEIQNLPRSYASSSRASERVAPPMPEPTPESVVDFDPAPVATNPIRDWAKGQRP